MEFPTNENITRLVLASFARTDSARLKELMEKLVVHLHAFARDTRLTREEWFASLALLKETGEISSGQRNEFMGFSDALGLTSLVELMQAHSHATPMNMLGPFYVPDAPELGFNHDLKGDQDGQPVLLRARVLDHRRRPIAGARVNMWQTRADGLYDVQVPGFDGYHFRGWLTTDAEGVFQVRTIVPKGYTAPMDGTLGRMLTATQRNIWRPAHWHFEIVAKGQVPLVTELYPKGSPHMDDDMAFGPREGLVVDLKTVSDPAQARLHGVQAPFQMVEFDFQLDEAPAVRAQQVTAFSG